VVPQADRTPDLARLLYTAKRMIFTFAGNIICPAVAADAGVSIRLISNFSFQFYFVVHPARTSHLRLTRNHIRLVPTYMGDSAKKALSERDICNKYITTALVAGDKWDLMTQIREEVPFTKGRVAEANPEFIQLALSSSLIRQQIEMPIRTTSGVKNINTQLRLPVAGCNSPSNPRRMIASKSKIKYHRIK
jgi:hypothetical protein